MKFRNLGIGVLIVVLLVVSASVALAKKGTAANLGKFAVGDVAAFAWKVDVTEPPPLWSVYRADAGDWSGLFHCSGASCWTQNVDGIWYGELLLNAGDFSEGGYMIDYRNCIRCFCCQEFCPQGAITVDRGWMLKMLGK